MHPKTIAQKLISLQAADEALRAELLAKGELSGGYHPELEALHNHNARELGEIIEVMGYPTTEKVGGAASEAAWLIIQHAIGQPDFMKRCCQLLEVTVDKSTADQIRLAYLTDRIAVFEGKLQRYGTQFDWDEHGVMNPQQFDDLAKVNQRRKSIGLNTLQEQLAKMRERVKQEGQSRPADLEARKRAYDQWRKSVGWIA